MEQAKSCYIRERQHAVATSKDHVTTGKAS